MFLMSTHSAARSLGGTGPVRGRSIPLGLGLIRLIMSRCISVSCSMDWVWSEWPAGGLGSILDRAAEANHGFLEQSVFVFRSRQEGQDQASPTEAHGFLPARWGVPWVSTGYGSSLALGPVV